MDHELKHVAVDREIVNDMSQSLGIKLYEGLEARGFDSGMVQASRAQVIGQRMIDTVSQIAEREQKRMELNRMDAQTAVDSREEYDAVSAKCR